MLDNGKIMVVVAVLSLILVGIIAYLLVMDNKIGKLEKEVRGETNRKEQ
jgi:hypothetical protein